MKLLKVFYNQTEAEIALQYLASNEISAKMQKIRGYANIITGDLSFKHSLYVEPIDYLKAKDLLTKIDTKESESFERGSSNYFKKSIFFAFAGMITIPILFNYASLVNAHRYWKNSLKDRRAKVNIIIILLLQIPAIFILLYILTKELHISI